MRIIKRAPDGRVIMEYSGALARRQTAMIVIDATWERQDHDLGYTVFAQGDRFIEFFYSDQWFNVLRIHRGTDGSLKGWYCNITRPAMIADATITYDDLYLDIWVDATYQTLLLDEDEFMAATLDEATRARARVAVETILHWVAERRGPFADPMQG